MSEKAGTWIEQIDGKYVGTLVDGLEWPIGSGNLQKDFVIRKPKVRDSVRLHQDTALIKEYGGNSVYMEMATIAVCLEKLGDIPEDKFCPGLLMDLTDRDGAVLANAFRGQLPRGIGATDKDS